MKIEKLNENQIRCTLTREDLESRNINLHELAYGTDKAKALFREMMRFASYKFGFEAEDIPLMIEAVPISQDKIVLIVTKVPYPDELDARFSDFSESDDVYDEDYYDDSEAVMPDSFSSAREILELFDKETPSDSSDSTDDTSDQIPESITRIFDFDDLDTIIELAHVLSGYFKGDSRLYRVDSGEYTMIISDDGSDPEAFNRVLNVISEYGDQRLIYGGTEKFITEHCQPILTNRALMQLALI